MNNNSCKFCLKPIPLKTKSGKTRKFCDKSCSRKYTCVNNPNTVIEANKKGYQTLLKRDQASEFLKHRGRSTEKKKQKFENRYDISKHSRDGGLMHNNIEVLEKRRLSMIKNGLWLDYKTFNYIDFKRYRQSVYRLTKKLYGSAGYGYEWDHVFPVVLGYKFNVPINIICSKENVEKMVSTENAKKGCKLTQKATLLYETWVANGYINNRVNDVWAA